MAGSAYLTQTRREFCPVVVAVLLLAGFCFGQPAITLSTEQGPPTTHLRVSGSGFTPHAQIDIFFDNQDEALVTADGKGAFSQAAIGVPASALSGSHWVSAVERTGQLGAQVPFNVHVNWTEFHTEDMMRWNPYENTLNINNVGTLQKLDSYQTSGGSSSPAVVNGVVYVGSNNGNVYAFNIHTRALLWSDQTGEDVVTSPAVANGVVYATSSSLFCCFPVYALNASTGAVLWSYTTGNFGAPSSPAVANGVVYFGTENSGTEPNAVYALNASTGALLWSYETGGYVESSPAVANGVVYVGSDDFNVYALNASTGALLWSDRTGGEVHSSPAVANGVVYIGSHDHNVYAVNASTGALLWSYRTGDPVQSSPAVANGVVYVASFDNKVYALNASTGAKLWSYRTGGAVYSSPAVANGVVYVGSDDNNVYALNASTGALLWSYPTSNYVESSPAVANGVVYIGSNDYKLYAFGLPRGLAEQAPERPDLKALRPDFNLLPPGQSSTHFSHQ